MIGETLDKIAADLVDLIRAELPEEAMQRRVTINKIIAALSPPPIPKQDSPPVNITGFSTRVMPYGKHSGQRYCEIPKDYLAWLADAKRQEWCELDAYLKTRKDDEDDA